MALVKHTNPMTLCMVATSLALLAIMSSNTRSCEAWNGFSGRVGLLSLNGDLPQESPPPPASRAPPRAEPCFLPTNPDYCTDPICVHVCEVHGISNSPAYCRQEAGYDMCCCPNPN
ncbi:hypothetical protein SETIT_8G177300v2 [Setaria italica]|uniref:Uncharacterized protein n=1 Tax=Setaria italica TaxID=4555 RepID=K3ZKC2_SETIT|nr:hypothetical protein SETIT_J026700v2 [Setaria italica]RCV38867.1 hypothetical protein SETIT_8G177000v2 [Setaria italica]RCV38871.1 hypothetical protein SETIT_8G177300v2 [Setaria italica]